MRSGLRKAVVGCVGAGCAGAGNVFWSEIFASACFNSSWLAFQLLKCPGVLAGHLLLVGLELLDGSLGIGEIARERLQPCLIGRR